MGMLIEWVAIAKVSIACLRRYANPSGVPSSTGNEPRNTRQADWLRMIYGEAIAAAGSFAIWIIQ